ncbi:HMW subunit of glutenin 1Dx2.2 [Kibdelosporangium sp. 4NS15]|uniref:HMW subunit of glutenin 1Dx2.2 n=1 Tax=Kibdelosporangium persicum TaxID=2698649 RepID=A0ABX2EZT0_9PSEU|nr:HMW subunit of glutenin 1Dx2.2 [Kibdelosporangium persicum]
MQLALYPVECQRFNEASHIPVTAASGETLRSVLALVMLPLHRVGIRGWGLEVSYPQGPQYGGYQQQPGGYPQQQGGYPQQQGYPQQPGPQQPGYPGQYPPPRKNNNGLIIALAGVAGAAVIALVLVLALSGGDDDSGESADGTGTEKPIGAPEVNVPPPNAGKPTGGSRPSSGGGGGGGASSPEALAETAIGVIESRSTSAIDELACSSSAASELKRELSRLPPGASAELQGVTGSGSTAQARIRLTVQGQNQTITMEMRKSGSNWCASGL